MASNQIKWAINGEVLDQGNYRVIVERGAYARDLRNGPGSGGGLSVEAVEAWSGTSGLSNEISEESKLWTLAEIAARAADRNSTVWAMPADGLEAVYWEVAEPDETATA